MTDVVCPQCKYVFNFKNVMLFEENEMELKGIIYHIKCLKCNHEFDTESRMSKKGNKRQMKKIRETLDEIKQ